MKRFALVIAIGTFALAGWSGPSRALDIKGKWGLSTIIFGGDGGSENSLMRVRSNQSVLALDVYYSSYRQKVEDIPALPGSNYENHNLSIGPRLRHFTRDDAEFSTI